MHLLSAKRIIISLLVLTVVGAGVFWMLDSDTSQRDVAQEDDMTTNVEESEGYPDPTQTVIGTSVEGRAIVANTYGDGDTHIMFVGGIHGGYEWNSVVLAYRFMDYLEENPEFVPEDLTVTVIPSANPDGVYEVVGTEGPFTADEVPPGSKDHARFNANGVDLNRNFDCNWESESMWRGEVVDAGTGPFSEPEAAALRDFVMNNSPDAAVFWHSQANAVYASECNSGILAETLEIMKIYANSAGYRAVPSFDAYPITGDAEGWLASLGIPAVSVELRTHETVEWEQNLSGVEALLDYYSSQ